MSIANVKKEKDFRKKAIAGEGFCKMEDSSVKMNNKSGSMEVPGSSEEKLNF